ncbi:MAG TPA: ABC transporter ATP-binding protein [Hyphomicrobiaceae bacterium]|nr:ABC transporter ATP-binding protein [Hyphomicrobiaceae bacterium]
MVLTKLESPATTASAPRSQDTIVNIAGVAKSFGEMVAVDNVSLAIRRGEFVSLLGPSGCGKSTLLRMIAGFEQPDAGAIEIDAHDVIDVPPNRRPVNMVFQSYALFPHLNVFDNVAFGLRRKRLPRAQVEADVRHFLQLVGLEALAQRYPTQLSGGQQQRVALARALVNKPKVLLLDEPLGALDLKLRKRMQTELKQLQRDVGVTFIYVTHDQDEALALSDRIAVMNRGALLQFASCRELYDQPRTEFVANFLGEANIVAGRVVAPGPVAVVEVRGHNIQVLDDTQAQPGDQVLVALRPEQLNVAVHGPSSGNVLQARVKDKVFLGNAFTLHLQVDPDVALIVRGTDRALFDGLVVGQAVAITWPLEHGRLVQP